MTFLLAKDDNLLLQTAGCLLTLVHQSKVSQALLYHSHMFPIGVNRKSMLLAKLLEAPQSPEVTGESPQKRSIESHESSTSKER